MAKASRVLFVAGRTRSPRTAGLMAKGTTVLRARKAKEIVARVTARTTPRKSARTAFCF